MNFFKTAAVAATLTFAASATVASVVLFEDDFGRINSNSVGNGWIELESGNADVAITGERLRLRDNLAGSPDAAAASFVIDATGYENLMVSFDWRPLNTNDGGERLNLSYALDPAPAPTLQAQWTRVFRDGNGGTTVSSESVSISPGADNSLFNIMFWSQVSNGTSGNSEGFFVDNVVVTGELTPVPLPAGGALLLGGLAAFGAMRRKR